MEKFAPKYPHTNRGRIKVAFVSQILTATAESIRNDQRAVAQEWNLFDGGSGRLKAMLTGHFSIANQEGGGKLSMSYLNYARFLDIPDPRRNTRLLQREGYHLYNRIVYGTLYARTFNELQFGLVKEVYEQIASEIDQAMVAKMPFYKRQQMYISAIASQDRIMAAMLAKRMRQGYR